MTKQPHRNRASAFKAKVALARGRFLGRSVIKLSYDGRLSHDN
jgi:hypothetical protein